MTPLVDREIEAYLAGLLPGRDEVLAEMEAYAAANNVPIVGPVVASFLATLAKASGARRIFEFGSAIGYSTIWWARAAGESAQVYYTDSSECNVARAQAYVQRAGVSGRVIIGRGMAQDLFRDTTGEFDILFCDCDKRYYPEVFHLALPRLRKGGLLIADNVLWSGRVARPVDAADLDTAGIVEWNRLIYSTSGLTTTVMPVRDGVSVSVKG